MQRGLAIALLLMYATTAIGVPLPSARGHAGGGAAYPCAGSGCGCDSAEHCWRSCCCHTLGQRLQWARKQGVQPPAFALEAARQEGLLDAVVTECTEVGATQDCCSKRVDAERTSLWTTTLAALVGGEATDSKQSNVAPDSWKSGGEQKAGFVVAWRALACNGQSLNWLAAVPAVVIPSSDLVTYYSLADWLGPLASESAAGISFDLVTPPPELS